MPINRQHDRATINRALAVVLTNERLRAGWNQTGVAHSLGVSPSTVSAWETGVRSVSVARLYELEEIYGLKAGHVMAAVAKAIRQGDSG